MSKHCDDMRRTHTLDHEDLTYLEDLLRERFELQKALVWLVNVLDGPTNKRSYLVNLPDALANARKVINSVGQETATRGSKRLSEHER